MKAALHDVRCDAMTARHTRCARGASAYITEWNMSNWDRGVLTLLKLCREHAEKAPRGLW